MATASSFEFDQQQQCPQLLIGSASSTEQGYVVAVLSTAAAGLGPFSIAQLLTQTTLAAIVFLDEPLLPGAADQQQFVAAVVALAPNQPLLLWGFGPDEVISGTGLVRQQLQRSGTALATNGSLTIAVTPTLSVTVAGGMTLGGQDTGITLTGSTPVVFSGTSAPANTTVVQGVALPCTGPGRGCVEFTAYVPQASLAAMNWGFAFGFPASGGAGGSAGGSTSTTSITNGRSGNGNGSTAGGSSLPNVLTAPLATPDTTAAAAGFTVDIDPLDSTRLEPAGNSAFTFTGSNLDRKATVLHSAYVSASGGQAVDLVPVTVASGPAGTVGAQLVITYPPITTGLPQYLHLAPAGDFVISTGSDDQVALLCGLQGTEYLLMQPKYGSYAGDVLRFVPGQAAYVPQLPLPVASPVGVPSSGDGPMTNRWITSWALTVPGGSSPSIVSVAQPPGFSLFGQDSVIYPSNANLMGSTSPGQMLSATPAQPLPLVPYGLVRPGTTGTTVDAATVALFETQVAAPLRHAALSADASDAGTSVLMANERTVATEPSAQTFTTPSGYLVSTTTNGGTATWSSILLGTLLESGEQFEFLNPDTTLQQAFQAGQLCLVAANDTYLGQLGGDGSGGAAAFANSLTIGGWGMSADTGQGQAFGDYANVLIVKGMPGPLYDPDGPADQNLVANPGKWTNADGFAAPSTIPAGSTTPGDPDPTQLVNLSQWLQSYFAAAAAETDVEYFASFNALAVDPNWTGVLLLRGVISGIPDGLEGITAGVTAPQLFNVHHLALNLTPIEATSTGPAVAKSTSVSGLIYYVDPSVDAADPSQPIATDPTDPYNFRLLTLKVLFQNSVVQSFSSYSQLTLRSMFGSGVSGMGTGGNSADAIVLTGSFQMVDGQPVYSMASATDAPFLMANSVLQRVEIIGLQMSTVSTGDANTTTSAFAMGGYLDFAIVPGGTDPTLDLFGFGNAADQQLPRKGISFSNLVLMMSFPTTDPASPSYTLDSSGLRFDLATSTVRSGSLVAEMSLQLSSLLQTSGSPADAGYLPVIGLIPGGDLGDSWNGLVLDVNLGTPGMLAASAGLQATMLLAWSPSPGNAQVQLGLHLPGTAQGAPLISLQNVLKLSIGQIQLAYDNTKQEYLLLLDSIALTFLGLLKIPPSGATSFYLFGSPASSTAGLGWYAIYNNEPKSTGTLTTGTRP